MRANAMASRHDGISAIDIPINAKPAESKKIRVDRG